ncbi:asparaginase domain-containing protein [Acinetobacter sp. WZC-1]|uniref:asparaginase domain-containing protein n=1 Tax=Acinetobacter sp. WZC-1 TaxID=3459034 RepID=UPI00403DE2F8
MKTYDEKLNEKIALIYMGGTFGCTGTPLAPMPEAFFLPQLQRVLPPFQQITCFTAPSVIDSSACTAEDWLKLIQQIQRLQQQDYQRFVIIHGTDTLSYAAAVLAQFLQQSCHVVVTGSQYPLLNTPGDDTREFTDAIDNLNTALDYVTRAPAGVYLAFYHQVFHAGTALKVHTTALDAFRGQKVDKIDPSPNARQQPAFTVHTSHVHQVRDLNIINWMMFPITREQLAQNLKNLLSSPPHALIIQAYGTGNLAVNAEIIHSFQQLQQAGCVVILSTQVPLGGIDQRYAISQWVTDAGILVSDALSQADLYARILKSYLQYPTLAQWHQHWYPPSE